MLVQADAEASMGCPLVARGYHNHCTCIERIVVLESLGQTAGVDNL